MISNILNFKKMAALRVTRDFVSETLSFSYPHFTSNLYWACDSIYDLHHIIRRCTETPELGKARYLSGGGDDDDDHDDDASLGENKNCYVAIKWEI